MRSNYNVVDLLAGLVENADRVEHYISSMDRETFAANGLVRDAVERCLEPVCEAAHRLGDAAAVLMPDQPWADIRGMGNRLRHAYDRISIDIVWNAAQRDLPSLVVDVRRVLKRFPADRDNSI